LQPKSFNTKPSIVPENYSGRNTKVQLCVFQEEGAEEYMRSVENRNLSSNPNGFPDPVATLGSAGVILIFHPNYVKISA
jgi:hypothetical protein